jgi:hypothetical protein
MSTQKSKFELFTRLQRLGFTYEEAVALRRIEMTLQRWAEGECGTGDDRVSRCIERDEKTDKPYMRVQYATAQGWCDSRYPIADREAGALRRLASIVAARNAREKSGDLRRASAAGHVFAYHQTDPRGCALYLLTREQLTCDGKLLPIDQYYNRGLAVCA